MDHRFQGRRSINTSACRCDIVHCWDTCQRFTTQYNTTVCHCKVCGCRRFGNRSSVGGRRIMYFSSLSTPWPLICFGTHCVRVCGGCSRVVGFTATSACHCTLCWSPQHTTWAGCPVGHIVVHAARCTTWPRLTVSALGPHYAAHSTRPSEGTSTMYERSRGLHACRAPWHPFCTAAPVICLTIMWKTELTTHAVVLHVHDRSFPFRRAGR